MPVVPGHRLCKAHLFKQRIKTMKIRLKYKAEGRCICCGRPLDIDADAGYVSCINCRGSRKLTAGPTHVR